MFQVFGTQLMTGSVTAFIMDNRWIMCQLLFAVYMSILAIMDIKWKKLSLSVLLSGFIILAARTFMRERYPHDSTGSRRGRRNCFSGCQQSNGRVFGIRGQYTDPDHGRFPWLLEYPFPACRSIFHGGPVFNLHAAQEEVSQKISISFCTVSYGGIYRRDDHWRILKRTEERKELPVKSIVKRAARGSTVVEMSYIIPLFLGLFVPYHARGLLLS